MLYFSLFLPTLFLSSLFFQYVTVSALMALTLGFAYLKIFFISQGVKTPVSSILNFKDRMLVKDKSRCSSMMSLNRCIGFLVFNPYFSVTEQLPNPWTKNANKNKIRRNMALAGFQQGCIPGYSGLVPSIALEENIRKLSGSDKAGILSCGTLSCINKEKLIFNLWDGCQIL